MYSVILKATLIFSLLAALGPGEPDHARQGEDDQEDVGKVSTGQEAVALVTPVGGDFGPIQGVSYYQKSHIFRGGQEHYIEDSVKDVDLDRNHFQQRRHKGRTFSNIENTCAETGFSSGLDQPHRVEFIQGCTLFNAYNSIVGNSVRNHLTIRVFDRNMETFQNMSSTQEIIAQAELNAKDEDGSGDNLSKRSMATICNFMQIASQQTVTTVTTEFSNVTAQITLQMQKDKEELKREIEVKNAANRVEINKDVREQIEIIEKKRLEDRQVDLLFKKKLEDMEKQRLKDRQADQKKMDELSTLVQTGTSTQQNMIVTQEILAKKIQSGVEVWDNNNLAIHKAASITSSSSLSSGRVVIKEDDPRRQDFKKEVDKARRTILLLVWDMEIYTGSQRQTDEFGSDGVAELRFYLSMFQNNILWGLFGIKDGRANYYMDQIESSPDAFKWRKPDLERSGEIRMEGSRPSPTKIYIRFSTQVARFHFEDEKKNLHKDARINVNSYFPHWFRLKFDALTTEGRLWKEEVKKHKSYAQFKVEWDSNEDEMYVETRTIRQGKWTRLTTDHPSLLKMSINNFENKGGDGYSKPDESLVERRRKEYRELSEARKGLNMAEKSDGRKRSLSNSNIEERWTEKFSKKQKGTPISKLRTNNRTLHSKPNSLDLDTLVDSSEITKVRVMNYISNREKVMKILKHNNVSKTYVATPTNRRIIDGKATSVFEGASVQVPTSLLLISMKTFLCWTVNKSFCVERNEFISITEEVLTKDRQNVPIEWKVRFRHDRHRSKTACVHLYLTTSKILSQGGQDYMQTTFGVWIWERVIKPVLDENLRLNPVEINMMGALLAQNNITEWKDNRLKDSAKKPKTPKSKKKAQNKAQGPQVVSSHRPLSITFGVVTNSSNLDTASAATKKQDEDDGKTATKNKKDGITPAKKDEEAAATAVDERSDSVTDVNDNGKEAGEIEPPSKSPVGGKDKSPVGEKEKENERVDASPEVEIINTPTEALRPRILKFPSHDDITNFGQDDILVNGVGNDFVSDDYTGVGDPVVIELPHDLVPRFKHIYETFTVKAQEEERSEVQVHLVGYRRTEGKTRIVTVTEMLIPKQEGNQHECHVTDTRFFKMLKPEFHVGCLHVHPDGTGCYMSGTDCHMCAEFDVRTGGPFVSGVFNPVKNEYGFMRIKETKLDAVTKCAHLSKIMKYEEHAHPEVWAYVAVKEINVPVVISDLRGGAAREDWIADAAKVCGPFDLNPVVRNLAGNVYTPLSKASYLQLHGQMGDEGLETLRKPYIGQASVTDAEKPAIKQPGSVHDDIKWIELSLPVETFLAPNQGQETIKGLLRQKRTQDVLKRPGMRKVASEPDLNKLAEEMERLNSLCADLTKANVGLQSELTRMKDSATIFGSTSFEGIDDHSLIARVLTVFGNVISAGMKSSDCSKCDWFGKLIDDLDKNKDKVTDVCGWLREAMTGKDGQLVDSICRSLRMTKPKCQDDKLTVISWNMCGHRKYSELLLVIDEVQPDIVMLQETMLNSSSQLNFQLHFPDYYFHSITADCGVGAEDLNLEDMEDSGGVSILWRKSLNSKVTKINSSFGGAVAIILNVGRARILLVSIYAPTYGKDTEFSNHLDKLSAMFDREEAGYDEIITLGDWNINEKSDIKRIEEMEVWCIQRGLIRKDAPNPTHRHFVYKRLTFLDCAYLSDPTHIKLMNTSLSFVTTSDHQPVTLTINVQEESRDDGGAAARLETSSYMGNLWKFRPDKLEKLNSELNRQLRWSESLPKSCSDARLVHINDTLVKVFNKVMPRPVPDGRKRGLYGLTRERKILQTLKKRGGVDLRMTSELNIELNEIRRKRRSTEQANIVKNYNKDPADVFKFVNKLKGRGPGCPDKLVVGDRTLYDKAAHEEIIHHYDRLGKFNHPLYNEDSQMNPDSIKVVTRIVNMVMLSRKVKEDKIPPIDLDEFKEVIKSFKTGKASDLSGVSHDMYRHLSDENLELIMEWINDLFSKDDFYSPELSKSRFSLLFKAGTFVSLGNYRRLTVSSIMLRILERILMRRGMGDKIGASLEDAQMGFRKSRCYQMALLEITELMRRFKTENSPLFVLSTDVAKAFPRQDPRINLLEMIKRGLTGGELKFSRDTYLGRRSHLKVNDEVYTKPNVADEYGETEGGTTCPLRASANFDIICKAINKSSFGVTQKGIVTSGILEDDSCVLEETEKRVPVRMMADDALYSLSTMYMSAACYKSILTESKHTRCHYNEAKCYLLALNVDFEKAEKEWKKIQEKENITLKLTNKLKYLGMTLSGDDEYDVQNVKMKIGGANGSLRIISGAGLNQQKLCSPKLRVSMVHSFVVSKCLSGLDGMRLSSAAEEQLRLYGEVLMRKTFFLHRNASTHLVHLIAGKIRLNAYWRLSQLNLLIRILGLNTQLAAALRWDFINETRGSWVYQAVTILDHYGIKDYSRLFLGNVVTTKNARSIYLAIKEQVVLQEFEYLKKKHLGQKWSNNFDLSSLRPGKPSRHILDANTVQEIRGVSTIIQHLTNTYATNTLVDRNATCVVCRREGVRDTPSHLWICEKATIARALRCELQEELPFGHPAKRLSVTSGILTKFILDPESILLEEYQLQERPDNFMRIQSLCRLIAHFSHQNRYRIAKKMKKADLWKSKGKTNEPEREKTKRPISFLEI